MRLGACGDQRRDMDSDGGQLAAVSPAAIRMARDDKTWRHLERSVETVSPLEETEDDKEATP